MTLLEDVKTGKFREKPKALAKRNEDTDKLMQETNRFMAVISDFARPGTDRLEQLGGQGIRIPYYPVPPRTLFDLAKYSDTVRTILSALKTETFRNGLLVENLWAAKCERCGHEYDEVPKAGTPCLGCLELQKEDPNWEASTEYKEPNERKKGETEKWMEDVNENHQSLQEVSESVHEDAGVIDDGFWLILKEYYFDMQGNITGAVIKENMRGDPIFMRIIADRQGRPGRDDTGKKLYTCVEHRDKVYTNKKRCPLCNKQLFQALYKADMETSGAMGQEGKTGVFYIEGEVIHRSLYKPSLTYGFSNIATGWQKIVTLMYQDSYIKEYYGKERPPRGLLFVNTSNNQSLQKNWQAHRDLQRQNPHDIYPIGMEFPPGQSGKIVEWVEFIKPLADMEYTESRNEYRRTIGGLWGVQPIFQNDIAQTGGLNNEGMQITVTNRTTTKNQNYVNKFLYEVSRQLGLIEEGLVIKLAPVEIKDAMSEALLAAQKINNANAMKNLGYVAELADSEFNFDFQKQALIPQQSPQAGLPQDHPPPEKPAEQAPMEASGTPMKSVGKKKGFLELAYESEVAELGFTHKAELTGESLRILESAVYSKKFDGMGKKLSDRIKDYLIEGVQKNRPEPEMVKAVIEMAGIEKGDAETIVRTEANALRNKLREISARINDPEGQFKYMWIGPNDYRTTDICTAIKNRSEKGVTLDKLKDIVEDEAHKADPNWDVRDWNPHGNCRHSFIRAF